MAVATAGGAALTAGASMSNANVQAGNAKQARAEAEAARAEERRKYEARKQAYDAIVARGGADMATGEKAFIEEAGQAPAELDQLKQDILSGQAETMQTGSNQMQADLAASGMRGGQAATALKRGTGNIATAAQRDVNQLVGGEAMQRAAERRAYQSAKAGRGQGATYAPPSF